VLTNKDDQLKIIGEKLKMIFNFVLTLKSKKGFDSIIISIKTVKYLEEMYDAYNISKRF
jgi:hypothetical protein